MAMEALVKPLIRLPLFRGLSPYLISEIACRAERVIYQPGSFLITEDEAADAAIVIVSGSCVQLSTEAVVNTGHPISEGAMLAEMAMLVETIHTSSVVARSPVKALRIAREELHAIMAEEPELAAHFSRIITNRLLLVASELRDVDKRISNAFAHAHTGPASIAHETSAALH